MTAELEKAKIALNKNFCFTQQQLDNALAAGSNVMEKEDIQFLLSLDNIPRNQILHLGFNERKYNSTQVSAAIEKAKKQKLAGVIFGNTIPNEDCLKLKQAGYFIRHTGHGSVFWDEVYFYEDVFVQAEVSDFKNLLDGLSLAVAAGVF